MQNPKVEFQQGVISGRGNEDEQKPEIKKSNMAYTRNDGQVSLGKLRAGEGKDVEMKQKKYVRQTKEKCEHLGVRP